MKGIKDFQRSFDDIPAIVGSGLPQLRRARYLLLHIDDRAVALEWLRQLIDSGAAHPLSRVRNRGGSGMRWPERSIRAGHCDPTHDVEEAVTLAFSWAGLQALGIREDSNYPFPTAFRDGMASTLRRKSLGDAPDPAWSWGDVQGQEAFEVHILAVHYWSEQMACAPLPLTDVAQLPAGLRARAVASCPSYIARSEAEPAMYEPFGFRDGVGQPVLDGVGLSNSERSAKAAAGRLFQDRVVKPGEFVLGQVNEYGERAYCPNVQDWPGRASSVDGFGRNGTYLAVRQIEQHVEVFKRFTDGHAVPQLGSRMIGRFSSEASDPSRVGYSLVRQAQPQSEIDAFRHLGSDAHGFECPRGAHARRANPRDALGNDVDAGVTGSKLHRLVRRGRVYTSGCLKGQAAEACAGHASGREGDTPCGRGLMFVALNSDLERQFEFVQKSWIAGSRFGDLADEQDPLLGTDPERAFTVQGCPVGERIGPLPRFTTVRGGGYFFAPSLTALRWLAQDREAAAAQPM